MDRPRVVVKAVGGLANRLRTVLSYRAAYGEIDVVWRPDGEICRARFTDVFEPLGGVRFYDDYLARVHETGTALKGGWALGYRDVELRASGRKRWTLFRSMVAHCGYAGIHLRRTDLQVDGAYWIPERAYLDWCMARPEPRATWLATDNGTTQERFLELMAGRGISPLYASRIRVHPEEDRMFQRNTNLEDAAIDLFMLAGADAFAGTPGSSFSDTVQILRRVEGWWS
jgi:hypothetical protein